MSLLTTLLKRFRRSTGNTVNLSSRSLFVGKHVPSTSTTEVTYEDFDPELIFIAKKRNYEYTQGIRIFNTTKHLTYEFFSDSRYYNFSINSRDIQF